MAVHYTNELIFDLPDNLIDMTNHLFRDTEEGPSEFNLVVSKDKIDPEETLQNYRERLLADMENNFIQLQFEKDEIMQVAGQEAFLLMYSLNYQGQLLSQAVVNFICDKEDGARQVIQIGATSPGKFTDEWKQAFGRIIADTKLRHVSKGSKIHEQGNR